MTATYTILILSAQLGVSLLANLVMIGGLITHKKEVERLDNELLHAKMVIEKLQGGKQ